MADTNSISSVGLSSIPEAYISSVCARECMFPRHSQYPKFPSTTWPSIAGFLLGTSLIRKPFTPKSAMSTVRRSKAMPTDSPTAKFLYTIIKQLDLKSVSRPFFLWHSQECGLQLTMCLHRLTGILLHRSLRYPTATLLGCVILALGSKWKESHLHRAPLAPGRLPRRLAKDLPAKPIC